MWNCPLCSGLLGRTISPVAAGGEADNVRAALDASVPISDIRVLGSGLWVLDSGRGLKPLLGLAHLCSCS